MQEKLAERGAPCVKWNEITDGPFVNLYFCATDKMLTRIIQNTLTYNWDVLVFFNNLNDQK